MIKRCARQTELLHESNALAHDCPGTIAVGTAEVGLKAANTRNCQGELPGPGLQHLRFHLPYWVQRFDRDFIQIPQRLF